MRPARFEVVRTPISSRRMERARLQTVASRGSGERFGDGTDEAHSRDSARLLLGSRFAGTALAAMDPAQTTPDAQVPAHMSQKLHDDLAKTRFTDIAMMPAA